MKVGALTFGLNSKGLEVGFNFLAAASEGVGETASAISCLAVSGIGTAGGFGLEPLQGGIAWIFIMGTFPGVAGGFAVLLTLGDMAAFALDSRTCWAARASISFCFSASLDKIGNMSFGTGSATWH